MMLQRFLISILTLLYFVSCQTEEGTSEQKTIELKSYLNATSTLSGVTACMPSEGECYTHIEGFEFKWGFQQTIKIKITTLELSGVDGASSVNYSLVEKINETEDAIGEVYRIEALDRNIGLFTKDENDDFFYFNKPFTCDEVLDCDKLLSTDAQQTSVNVNFEYLGDSDIKLLSWY